VAADGAGDVIALWLVGAAWALDLDEARAVAVDRAIAVERAEASADVAQAGAAATWAGALPSVTAFGDWTTGAGFTQFGIERQVASQVGVGLTARWALVAPSTWAAADSARRTARGADAVLDWARVSARQQATIAYAAAWGAAGEAAVMQRAVDDAAAALDAVQQLRAAGLAAPADKARAEAEHALVVAQRAAAVAAATARCGELNALLRRPLTACELGAPAWSEPSAGVADHPALVAAEEAVGAARAATTAAGLRWAPVVEVYGTGAEYAAGGQAGPGWVVGVGADLPLIAGGGQVADVKAAAAGTRDAVAALEEQERAIELARMTAESDLEAARASVAALDAAVASAERALELVDEQFRAGLADLTTWVAARRARDEAAVARARGEGSLGAALAAVEAARGVR
jgi:outer membrane protein TolC